MSVRVIRTIEITYPSLGAFEADSKNWALQPGSRREWGHRGDLGPTVYRSSMIGPFETFAEEMTGE